MGSLASVPACCHLLCCCVLSGPWEVKADSEGRDACLNLMLYADIKEPFAFLMWTSGAIGQGPAWVGDCP